MTFYQGLDHALGQLIQSTALPVTALLTLYVLGALVYLIPLLTTSLSNSAADQPICEAGENTPRIHALVPSCDRIGPSMERFFGKTEVGKGIERMDVGSLQADRDS